MPNGFYSSLVFSILYTIVLYGVGPFLFARLRKQKIARKTVAIFCLIYTVSAWLLSNLVLIAIYERKMSSGSAAMIWGLLFYFMLLKSLIRRGLLLPKSPTGTETPLKEPDVKDRWYTCPKCGQLVKEGEACDCAAFQKETPSEVEKIQDMDPITDYPAYFGWVSRKTLIVVIAVAVVCCGISAAVASSVARSKGYDEGWNTGYELGKQEKQAEYEQAITDLSTKLAEAKSNLESAQKKDTKGKLVKVGERTAPSSIQLEPKH